MTDTMIEQDETDSLIASNKIEGTPVFDQDGEKLGTIHSLMVDKRSGQADYAVLTFGGLFGLGSDHYPIPWDLLDYDEELGGYTIEIDTETLESAPHYGVDAAPAFDRAYADQIHSHYGVDHPLA